MQNEDCSKGRLGNAHGRKKARVAEKETGSSMLQNKTRRVLNL